MEIALEGLGHEVHRQVGTAGFIIDLAIVDPVKPGRYLLGIECDGATYHSSRSARDRDRLRETVLKDRGWKIHRVWSTDWFHRPAEQLQKIVAAIEKARIDWDCDEEAPDDHDDNPVELDAAPGEIERNKEPDGMNGESHFAWACAYVESNQAVPNSTPIPETRLSILQAVVTTLVQIEGPIHKDEIARRITSLWGLQRTGPRIAEAISSAVEAGIRSGKLRAELDFIAHSRAVDRPGARPIRGDGVKPEKTRDDPPIGSSSSHHLLRHGTDRSTSRRIARDGIQGVRFQVDEPEGQRTRREDADINARSRRCRFA